jgi:hypothetical protein
MSKPVNRRQFLLGKFLGILMACMAMSLVLGLNLNAALKAMPEFDKSSGEVVDPMPTQANQWLAPKAAQLLPAGPGRTLAEGAALWFGEAFAHTWGIALGFGQVMILVAIATALATRMPFIVNLVVCLIVYFLGHLAPVIVRVTEHAGGPNQSTGMGLIKFLGNLFDVFLPALEFFTMGPAIIREAPLRLDEFIVYVATVLGYAVIYTIIALIVGLLLFEDRDLA